MQNNQACVWATRRDLWDSFLNDPELALAIESARSSEPAEAKADQPEESGSQLDKAEQDNEKLHRIGARLRAYETPITDEILRQYIR